ncbi:hypothetical protein GQX74_012701 [Glossina fuscipes]|nr:hypothetical protein GQX74_012701 [Glossina fuscipes]
MLTLTSHLALTSTIANCLTIYMSMFTYLSLRISVLMISISSNSSTMTLHDIANCRTRLHEDTISRSINLKFSIGLNLLYLFSFGDCLLVVILTATVLKYQPLMVS